MEYRVEVDWAPAYELIVSLKAFASKDQKALELRSGWAAGVHGDLDPELASLDACCDLDWLDLLVWLCPGKRDAAGFLHWLATVSVGELCERLEPYAFDAHDGRPLSRADLSAMRDLSMRVLPAWNERYFRCVEPAVLCGLEQDAAATRDLLKTLAPVEVVELATGGCHLSPTAGPTTVLLVPQYHYRPFNLTGKHRRLRLYLYPADVLPPAPGEPPPGLLRLTRALADESRLRILRLLAGGPRNFTGVVQETGLAKSTVHHHVVVLRAAGLVRVHEVADSMPSYSLRPRALNELVSRLGEYLTRD